MSTSKKKSAPEMLSWQYRTLMAQLDHVFLHGSDDSCPCNEVDLGADGKHHPEYCLGKHLNDVNSIAIETAYMDVDEKTADMLLGMASEALEYHNKAKNIYCKGGTWPDLATWARNCRKQLEPIYYSCSVKLHESVLARLFEKHPVVRVSGNCKGNSCDFKVTHTKKTESAASSIAALPRSIEEVMSRVESSGMQATDLTFAYGTTGLIRYDLKYRIVDGKNLIVSNDPFTFEPNSKYPQELQP
jgi:hypothetical protein